MIRIADSIPSNVTLERIAAHEKNGRRFAVQFSAGVAALHLTLRGLRGTVQTLVLAADGLCATSSHLLNLRG
jgi:hypothetical protein